MAEDTPRDIPKYVPRPKYREPHFNEAGEREFTPAELAQMRSEALKGCQLARGHKQ
jgi:hypothetical protein